MLRATEQHLPVTGTQVLAYRATSLTGCCTLAPACLAHAHRLSGGLVLLGLAVSLAQRRHIRRRKAAAFVGLRTGLGGCGPVQQHVCGDAGWRHHARCRPSRTCIRGHDCRSMLQPCPTPKPAHLLKRRLGTVAADMWMCCSSRFCFAASCSASARHAVSLAASLRAPSSSRLEAWRHTDTGWGSARPAAESFVHCVSELLILSFTPHA